MTSSPTALEEQSLDELHRHAGMFFSAMARSGMPLAVTNPRLPDNPLVFVNPAFEQLTGYSRAEVIGRNCRFLQTSATDSQVTKSIRAALAEKRDIDTVILNARKDGILFWNKLSISPIFSSAGELLFFFGTQADVTASHESYAAHIDPFGNRSDSEATGGRSRPLLALSGSGGAWNWDIRSGTLIADAHFAALHGQDPIRLARGVESAVFFQAIHPDDLVRIRMGVAGMLSGAAIFSKDFRLVLPDGQVSWVHAEGRVHLDQDDRPVIFTGRLIDITEQKRMSERLRIAQVAGGVGTFEYLEGFATVMVSPQFCALLGLRQANVLPISTINAVLQGELTFIEPEPAATSGALVQAEFCIQRADTGETRWIVRRGELIRDSEAGIPRLVGVIYDVTAEKERESQLRDLNETLELRVAERTRDRDRVWKNSRDILVIMNADGVIRGVNPAWTSILGHRADTVTGRSFFDFAASPYGGNLRQAVAKNFESHHLHPDGTSRWVSWLTAEEGDLIYAYGRHITREKLHEDALQLEQARLRTIFDTTSQLVGFTEPDGSVIVLNKALLEAIGIGMSDVAGHKLWDLPWFTGTPGAPETIRTAMAAARQGEASTMGIELTLPDGSVHTYDLALRPVRDHTGQTVQIVPEAYDTTILRRTEELLRQSQKMEAIGQLTGGIAHDFNNLLMGIMGSLDMIRRRLGTGKQEDFTRFLDAASTSAQRAASLTHRLLAFARRQSLDVAPSDINDLVVGIEDLLRRSLGEQIVLRIGLEAELWPAMTDANQLESALLNLAINARDAMPDGGELVIETHTTHVGPHHPLVRDGVTAGNYVTISVSDTGTGIPPDVLDKVFDPFFTTKAIGQGTGLGLSMVYGFVKQSGGHVELNSEVGIGTTVKLHLPYAVTAVTREEDTPEAVSHQGRGETVLVVEDDATVRLLITEVLDELGYRFLEAANGREAVPIIESSKRLDLIISDVGLPGLNGRQVAEIARGLRPGIKVLFVTGYAESAAIRSGFLAPGMEIVVKPFPLDTLAAQIRKMLES